MACDVSLVLRNAVCLAKGAGLRRRGWRCITHTSSSGSGDAQKEPPRSRGHGWRERGHGWRGDDARAHVWTRLGGDRCTWRQGAPHAPPRASHYDARPLPDASALYVELRRWGVTQVLLHLEDLESHPDGYPYTKSCDAYRERLERRAPTMRQVRVAGGKMLVDHSGKSPHHVDMATREAVAFELFVAALGASSNTYAGDAHARRSPTSRRATRALSPSSVACLTRSWTTNTRMR